MKKNFFKKLALVMALTLAVGSVPANNVEAAAAPKFKHTSVTLTEGATKNYGIANVSAWSVKKIVTGNKSVATVVKKGKVASVTAVAEGKTTLRADLMAYKSKRTKSIRMGINVKAAEVTEPETPVVETELSAVRQTAANAFEATFTADASEKFTVASFTNIETADGVFSAYVKSVEFAADGKTAMVTTFGNFVDKAVYNVTCGDKTASFTASVGAVDTAVIKTVQAQANVETDVEFALYDANGMDVTSAVKVDTYVTLDADGDYADAQFKTPSDATITLDTVGNTATVTLTYDPLTNDGKVVTTTGTIVCVATQATVGATTYFTKASNQKIYLNSFAPTNTLYEDDATTSFIFAALDENGNAIKYDSYEVESSNESIITADLNTTTFEKKAVIDVAPQGVGTAKVIIKATKNEVETVYAGTVIVKAERVLAAVSLSTTKLSISEYAQHDNDGVYVELKDQYGNTIPNSKTGFTWSVDMLNGNGEIETDVNTGKSEEVFMVYSAASLDATPAGTAWDDKNAGDYVLVLGATDGTKTITKKIAVKVNDVNFGTTPTYKVELSDNSMDLNPELRWWNNKNGNITAKVARYFGTVFAGYVDKDSETLNTTTGVDTGDVIFDDFTVSVKYGALYLADSKMPYNTSDFAAAATPVDQTGYTATVGLSLDTVDTTGDVKLSSDKNVNGIAANGTYTVSLIYTLDGDATNKEYKKSATFTVKNTMEMPTVTVEKTLSEETTYDAIVVDCVKVDNAILVDDADENTVITDALDKDFANTTLSTALGTDKKFITKYIQVEDTFGTTNYVYYVPCTKTFKTK